MNTKSIIPCALALLLGTTGCEKVTRALPKPSTESTDAKALRLSATPRDQTPLALRLELEAKSLPDAPERTVAVLDKVTRGTAYSRLRQVLGAPIDAAYCSAATTESGVAISVCLYADEARARAGQARSHQLFDGLLPDRTLVVSGDVLITLAPANGPDSKQDAARLAKQLTTGTASAGLQTLRL